MSVQEKEREPGLIMAEVGGSFKRFASLELVPADARLFTDESVRLMPTEEASELYAKIAHVPLKKFKDAEKLLESLFYQANKLPLVGAPTPVEDAAEDGQEKTAKVGKTGKAPRKLQEIITILKPPNHDKLFSKLPAQAKALVTLMVELAAELGRTEFSGDELLKKISTPKAIEMMSNTTQPPLRIFTYYSSRLTTEGWIRTR